MSFGRIAVIGGGAAGMMAAGTAASYGAEVVIFEHMPYLGKKLGITGKGRCNVTNNCTVQEFMENVPRNSRFLYSALNALSPSELMDLLVSYGVELKTERGRRVFPTDDKAKTIVDALRRYCAGAEVVNQKIKNITRLDGRFSLNGNAEYTFDALILCTGGRSYPLTGSDGSGYKLARSLGHSVTPLVPSLIPLTSPSKICEKLQGLSLKNVGITLEDPNGKIIYTDFGEMMFTHFGVTGPVILSASAHLVGKPLHGVKLAIDLKPALDEKTLDQRLLLDFEKCINKDFINSLGGLLPLKLIEPFVELTDIDPRAKINSITKEQRKRIVSLLKRMEIPIDGVRPIEEAIITSGGITVSEVSPKSMESKIVPGLYFAGEVLDLDAYTGGYNLQIAFSTGYLAGKSAAENILYR